ncbi:MAG: S9 family peptidase, partial [Akkermansiaceae bacterium]|nr:S9 family peptidase [Akkermansiaceae bacterium]
SKFSGAAWSKDHRGFYYSRYDEPKEGEEFKAANLNQKVYYHLLGTRQQEDRLVYERPDHPKWRFSARPTEDGKYLLLDVHRGSADKNALFYRDLSRPDGPFVELLKNFDARYDFIGNEETRFWIRTDLKAPRGRVIEIDLGKPAPSRWKTVLSQSLDTMREVSLVGNEFVVSYMHDAHSLVRRYTTKGVALGELALPGLGSVHGFYGKREHRETFYSFTSYTEPPAIYRFDFDSGETSVHHRPKLGFDPVLFQTRQVFYRSKDGTQIPMFIVSRKGLQRDGKRPTLLHAYGGFHLSLLPRFSTPT